MGRRNFTAYTDEELVGMLRGQKADSEAAFTELYDRYSLRLNAYCRSIIHNREQAEDIFQETFLRFYQHVRSDMKTGSIIGYLIKIARNLCLNFKRDAKPNVSIEDFDFPVYDSHQSDEKELSELVMMSLELLDPETKEVLILRVFNDLSYNEIAEIVGITAARARYLVFNSKSKIKTILTPYFKDEYN